MWRARLIVRYSDIYSLSIRATGFGRDTALSDGARQVRT